MSDIFRFGGQLMDECYKVSKEWIDGDGPATSESFVALTPPQKITVLLQLYHSVPLPEAKLEKMERLYHLDQSANAEIRFAWIHLALASRFHCHDSHFVAGLQS